MRRFQRQTSKFEHVFRFCILKILFIVIIELQQTLATELAQSVEMPCLARLLRDGMVAAAFLSTASSVDTLVAAVVLAATAIVDTVGSMSVISAVAIVHATGRSIPHTFAFFTRAVASLAGTRRSTISSTNIRVGTYGPGEKDVSLFLPGVRANLSERSQVFSQTFVLKNFQSFSSLHHSSNIGLHYINNPINFYLNTDSLGVYTTKIMHGFKLDHNIPYYENNTAL
ncbi:hypothetical protein HELRODRAFT_158623 [Helobdella robusta]|uniref:Uncharacterized protein n=1 Tax=Helobdella robusta TaxID=6412 RepID=T1EN09_HELRO|nr:hypothetical protein HELRODRAFT_158623 [Helobdella robusta]ESO12159.1 hypothetical protein HELRODRAFT_158623 [Helobdella robusta]